MGQQSASFSLTLREVSAEGGRRSQPVGPWTVELVLWRREVAVRHRAGCAPGTKPRTAQLLLAPALDSRSYVRLVEVTLRLRTADQHLLLRRIREGRADWSLRKSCGPGAGRTDDRRRDVRTSPSSHSRETDRENVGTETRRIFSGRSRKTGDGDSATWREA